MKEKLERLQELLKYASFKSKILRVETNLILVELLEKQDEFDSMKEKIPDVIKSIDKIIAQEL